MEELLEVVGVILATLVAMLGVGIGVLFAANVGETRGQGSELVESFLVVG